MIDARTKLYAVLGHPVSHSLSPPMQNAAFAALGINAAYLAFDVAPDRLPALLPALAELGFAGLNLTVPLKEPALQCLSDLDESAARMRSVNTVRMDGHAMRGYSTDGAGFLAALRAEFSLEVRGRSMCLLGCGGAGRAVAIACALAGAAEIRLANRSAGRAERLAAEIAGLPDAPRVSLAPAQPAAWREACRQAEIVVQATSVGLRPGDPPLVGADAFQAGQWFYDLIYHVPETATMRAAATAGARAANGLGMLLYQGALALEIWTGRPAPVAPMRRALQQAVYGDNLP